MNPERRARRSRKAARVLTQHNDPQRTGHNKSETILDHNNVEGDQFGKLFEFPVDGFIFAQPLYVPQVAIPGRARTKIDLVIVATTKNLIYAFDAQAGGPDPCIWQARLGTAVPSNAFGHDYNDMYHADIGILGTPVVDPKTSTLYAISMTYDLTVFDRTPEQAFAHHLHALDLATGKPKNIGGRPVPPRPVAGRVPGKGYMVPNRTGKTADRRGDDIVLDASIPSDRVAAACTFAADTDLRETRQWKIRDGIFVDEQPYVVFNSMMQLQRPGLLLNGGCVFSAFGSHGDNDPYHGWVFAHDAETLALRGVFCTSANGSESGVWQAGEGIVADDQGFAYVGTGNGDTRPDDGNYGECVVRLGLDDSSEPGLHALGFANVFEDPSGGDEDFGASSPTILPDGYLIGGGKDGNFYLFDPEAITLDPFSRPVRQVFLASYDLKTFLNKEATHHIHGSPVVYRSRKEVFVYVWGENDYV